MVTSVEYGLIAALIAVAGTAAFKAATEEEQKDDIVTATCTAASISSRGTIRLSCEGDHPDRNHLLVSPTMATIQGLKPRPMECQLRLGRHPAECDIIPP